MAFLREDAVQAISFFVTPAKAGVRNRFNNRIAVCTGVSGLINCVLKKLGD